MKQHIFVCTETNTSWQILSLVNASGGRVILLYPSPPVSKRKCFGTKKKNTKYENNITTDHFEKQRVIMHIIIQTLYACWKQKTSQQNRTDETTVEIAIS